MGFPEASDTEFKCDSKHLRLQSRTNNITSCAVQRFASGSVGGRQSLQDGHTAVITEAARQRLLLRQSAARRIKRPDPIDGSGRLVPTADDVNLPVARRQSAALLKHTHGSVTALGPALNTRLFKVLQKYHWRMLKQTSPLMLWKGHSYRSEDFVGNFHVTWFSKHMVQLTDRLRTLFEEYSWRKRSHTFASSF